MEKASLECPFCCNKTFDSLESLKNHILNILHELKCPICKIKICELENFTQHLSECKTIEDFPTDELCESKNTNEENENSVLVQDCLSAEENHAETEYYCEICDVYFVQMKKHLMENHMGQQVVVESQDLDGILEETEVNGQDETGEKIEIKTETSPTETEHIFLEQEILDDDGVFYTKKFTKINIIPEYERHPPVVEELFYEQLPNVKEENTVTVYRCQVCNIGFSQLGSYNKHDCNSKKGEVCNICSVHFSTKSGLTQHKKKYHGETALSKDTTVCDVCHIEFPTERSMVRHKRIHAPISNKRIIEPPATYNINGTKVSEESNETFTCEICGSEYNKKYEEVHMKSHKEEPLNCSICNRKFPDKDDLSMHLQAHGNEVQKKMSCRFCKKTFSVRQSLDDHVRNQCEGRKYTCDYCGRKFSKPHEKVKHERIHTGHKPHICQICGKGFRVSYCLTLHMRTHSGVRPYQCEICEKRFKSHGAYSHHIQIHSDVRSYQCPFCPKAFKTAVQLAGHKNTHTKPFSCNICSRPFASLYAVRLHTKSHDRPNELKHQCHICGAEYIRHSALKEHLGTHSACEKKDLQGLPKKIRKRRNTQDGGKKIEEHEKS